MGRIEMISAALSVALTAGTTLAAAFNRGGGICRASSEDDVITGSGVRDVNSALNGNDQIVDTPGVDDLVGSGMDTVTGDPGNDVEDRLRGGFANDTIYASDGEASTID
jgi:hypothetical protein